MNSIARAEAHVMTSREIPAGRENLSPQWLTDALRETDVIENARVTSFESEIIGEGAGFMGQLAQVDLQYDPPEADAPRSLIAKFPNASPENRRLANMFSFYDIETHFYREIADEIELRTPCCYYSALDPETHDFVLLLEDLAPARVGDQLAGCSPAQAELAIHHLAKFHATWWENPRLDQLGWLPDTNDPVRAQTTQAGYQMAWGPFVDGFGDQVPPSMLEIGERFGRNVARLMDGLAASPRTIMHADYRLDNLFFATPEGGDPLAVIDWQLCQRGRGAFDIAYFVTFTLPPEERKAKEMRLLHDYHRVLTECGVQDYDFAACLRDYRLSALFCWLYAVIDLGGIDTANERGLALAMNNLHRSVAAVTDLNAQELIPE
jgi:hypothetical protein